MYKDKTTNNKDLQFYKQGDMNDDYEPKRGRNINHDQKHQRMKNMKGDEQVDPSIFSIYRNYK